MHWGVQSDHISNPNLLLFELVRDAFKKKTPYGGTLSQLGGEGANVPTFEGGEGVI